MGELLDGNKKRRNERLMVRLLSMVWLITPLFLKFVVFANSVSGAHIDPYYTLRTSLLDCPQDISAHPESYVCNTSLVIDPQDLLRSAALCATVMRDMGMGEYPLCTVEVSIQTPFSGIDLAIEERSEKGLMMDLQHGLVGYTVTTLLLGGISGPWEYAPHIVPVTLRTLDSNGKILNEKTQWAKSSGNIDEGVVLILQEPLPVLSNAVKVLVAIPPRPIRKNPNLTNGWFRAYATKSFVMADISAH
ncbi:putative transmembrane protein [Gregarina niphandrodes]|uniref:Transmembrane protein n=1 Tax=Gregarina niphandrodes TaxID=110365 RepID=A0A023B5A8_GRENI|nr:putative transmembrane protein [Gregarina niphandrodes]EZG59071.1 putative transmembrane protein [Gregarina niphandrodes]|eukprot:XP_011130910.1 putative transmembrane protein [Gregarina niphandrodes]